MSFLGMGPTVTFRTTLWVPSAPTTSPQRRLPFCVFTTQPPASADTRVTLSSLSTAPASTALSSRYESRCCRETFIRARPLTMASLPSGDMKSILSTYLKDVGTPLSRGNLSRAKGVMPPPQGFSRG